MNNKLIKERGVEELEKINIKGNSILRWKNWLYDYQFNNEYLEDKYIWLSCILALHGVYAGNFALDIHP